MEIRLRSTIDGAIVGLASGTSLALVMGLWGVTPTNSPSDIIFTCLIAGGMVGWVFEDGFRHFSFLGGLMTGFTTIFMMAFGALPFALFSKMMGIDPMVINGEETTTAALALLLITGIAGVVYQKLVTQTEPVSSPTLVPQQLSVEN